MRQKILTVDDSKTVRIIVRKAFKGFDCEILEAANGIEGLAVAVREAPNLILLDVTMPVMDGVEMLSKIKSDPQTKGIPVMMLTAEGGRDQVLKIAKIGVRDYIVKPFKEDTLLEKAARILDLQPLSAGAGKARSITDALDVLVVEDKPAIIQLFQEGLKHLPWRVHGAGSPSDATDFCSRQPVDLIVISLSLPGDAGFALWRGIRAGVRTKCTPVFALAVRTDVAAQNQAQQLGFSAIVTKPIDFADLEAKISKALNLDVSARYYRTEGDALVLSLPETCTPAVMNEALLHLKSKLTEAVDNGLGKAIFDLHPIRSIDTAVIKLLLQAMQTCGELAVQFALVGNPALIAECKGFEDTRTWTFHGNSEEARAFLACGRSSSPELASAPGNG